MTSVTLGSCISPPRRTFFVLFRETLCDQSLLTREENQSNNENAPDCGIEEFGVGKLNELTLGSKRSVGISDGLQCGWCLAMTVIVTVMIVIFTLTAGRKDLILAIVLAISTHYYRM